MCGIYGQINREKPVDEQLLNKCINSLFLRGPDSSGAYTRDNVGMGFRRLAIIDLSPDGNQPMFNEDGNLGLTFNGECYNYLDLKGQLNDRHVWKSKTDTEVLIHGFEEWGTDLFVKMEGLTGAAFYDFLDERLYLVRDHFGKKPIYYYHDEDTFVYGSEIKSILTNPEIKKKMEIDTLSLQKYLFYGYVPSPHSIFKQIKKVPPSSHLVFDAKTWQIEKITRYWHLEDVEKRKVTNEEEILDDLEVLLDKAVEKRLMSDVPLGMFLSGGIDSSLVSYYLSKHASNLDTFTVAYKEIPNIDEAAFAKKAAERFDLNYHLVEFEDSMVEETFLEMMDYLDEPLADAAVIPLYFISKAAAQDITVVLSGDGGDEVFGGYGKYKAQQLIENRGVLKYAASLVEPFLSEDSQYLKLIRGFDMPFEQRQFFFGSGSFFAPEVEALLGKKINMDEIFSDAKGYLDEFKQEDVINSSLYLDCKIQLPDWYLVKGDRATMANSQEMRNPLLDKELAEYLFSLSGSWKVRGGETKYLAKKLAARHFDKEFVYRSKRGFAVPMDKWIKEELNDVYKEYLFKDFGYFNPVYVKQLYEDHMRGRYNNQFKLLRIFGFNYFYDKWVL